MKNLGMYIFLTGLIILAIGAGIIMVNLSMPIALPEPKGL